MAILTLHPFLFFFFSCSFLARLLTPPTPWDAYLTPERTWNRSTLSITLVLWLSPGFLNVRHGVVYFSSFFLLLSSFFFFFWNASSSSFFLEPTARAASAALKMAVGWFCETGLSVHMFVEGGCAGWLAGCCPRGERRLKKARGRKKGGLLFWCTSAASVLSCPVLLAFLFDAPSSPSSTYDFMACGWENDIGFPGI